MLCAPTACTFSTSQLQKVLRTWGVFSFLTCTCASRHNGVQFFISHLASWLRTRRFSEPTFRPSGATNHWEKTQCFATFLPFRAPGSLSSETLSFVIFFLLRFSSLTLPISASHLSILSEVWLLNFLRYSHFPSTSDWLVWYPLFNQTQKSFVGSCWFYIPSIALLLITRSGSRLWIPIIHSLLDIPMISQ